MADFGKLVQKAFYLGMGVASVAADRAGAELAELRKQAQKLADELVERGEMTTQDAREFVDNFVTQQMKQAESAIADAENATDESTTDSQADGSQPRKIQIDEASTQIVTASSADASDTEPPQESTSRASSGASETAQTVSSQEALRQEIDALKAELDRLRKA